MSGRFLIAVAGVMAVCGSAQAAFMLDGTGSMSNGWYSGGSYSFVMNTPIMVPELPGNTPNLGTPPRVLQVLPVASGENFPQFLELDNGIVPTPVGPVVPEPATAALAGLGMAILALRQRRA